jgi:hypothetical protein
MREFGLYLNNGDNELITKIIASNIYEAQQIFCQVKNLSLYDLLIIFNIREIE